MQLTNKKTGWIPVTLAVSVMAGGTMPMYADFDQFSNINMVINNHITSKYIAEVNDPNELQISDRLKFENYLSSWIKNTQYLSSIEDIINQKDFQAIISMGPRAVPFIGETIDMKPSVLVWALNIIFQTKISQKPDITIKEACKLWVKELTLHGWM